MSFKTFFNQYDIVLYALKNYFCNEVLNIVPFHSVRLYFYRSFLGVKIGSQTSIGMHTILINPTGITVGNNCAIGQGVYLDGRGGLNIGSNVNIAGRSSIYTASHNSKSPKWEYIQNKVIIGDHVWIASNAVVLPGCKISKGAIVAAGSVVTKDVSEFEIFGGNPAKKIGERVKKIEYLTNYFPYFY